MKRTFWVCFSLVMLWCVPAFGGALQVNEGVIATGISDRRPVNVAQSFPVSAGKLYCFSVVSGAETHTSITHVWYRKGKEIARTELPVRSSLWRTWSSKKLIREWTGEWEVKILDEEGNLLLTIPFTLT